MKGIIFTIFGELIEEKFGLAEWDAILQETQLESGGIYTAAGTYSPSELIALLGALSKRTGHSIDELLVTYGQHLLGVLAQGFPSFFTQHTAKSFLLSIHDVIHVEVKKLYPKAELPDFTYVDTEPDALTMKYRSERRLCRLAEGLIRGTATHFDTPIQIDETQCMHHGAEHCQFELKFT